MSKSNCPLSTHGKRITSNFNTTYPLTMRGPYSYLPRAVPAEACAPAPALAVEPLMVGGAKQSGRRTVRQTDWCWWQPKACPEHPNPCWQHTGSVAAPGQVTHLSRTCPAAVPRDKPLRSPFEGFRKAFPEGFIEGSRGFADYSRNRLPTLNEPLHEPFTTRD